MNGSGDIQKQIGPMQNHVGLILMEANGDGMRLINGIQRGIGITTHGMHGILDGKTSIQINMRGV